MSTTSSPPAARALRSVMAEVCTPVSVVTAFTDGRPYGSTVSAFSSLSMSPPMVLVALDRDSETLRAIRSSWHFGLNVLHAEQSALAMNFARKGQDKFDTVAWSLAHSSPRLTDVAGWIGCRVDSITAGGDHVVVTGEVLDTALIEVAPLTYHRRTFGTHAPLATAR